MQTCEDCIHNALCKDMVNFGIVDLPYDDDTICDHFKDRAEDVKTFAERLKDLKHECGCNYRKKPVFAVTEDKIDNLVKEMVGEG